MPGWQSSTEGIRQFKDLPDNAKHYVKKIEDLLNVPGDYFNSPFILVHIYYVYT